VLLAVDEKAVRLWGSIYGMYLATHGGSVSGLKLNT
jgi:hypothetical protein